MNGELAPVLSLSWNDVWLPLSRRRGTPSDLFNELVSELADPPEPPAEPAVPSVDAFDADGVLIDPEAMQARELYERALKDFNDERQRFEIAASGGDARSYFRNLLVGASASETQAVRLIEGCYVVFDEYGGDLREQFTALCDAFFSNRNLSYRLGADRKLYPSMPGVFARLLREVRSGAALNPHTQQLLDEFEESLQDLRLGRTEARLKTCLLRQFNLLEALGRGCPGVTAHTLGGICDQLQWPHATIREVGKKLYGFRSDYPGLGHAGNPQSVLGPVSLKDFVSISMMLTSFTPYLLSQIDAERCYGGA